MIFRDRAEAGRTLLGLIPPIEPPATVLAIPNGGVVVGAEIARGLKISLHLIVVRKIQLPWTTESGFGSVASDGSVLYNQELLPRLGLTPEEIRFQTEQARRSVEERLRAYRVPRSLPSLSNTTVILVDDGLASGITMESAIRVARALHSKLVLAAVPTASAAAAKRIRALADALICPDIRGGGSFAVASAYENWYDVGDGEVKEILASLRPG